MTKNSDKTKDPTNLNNQKFTLGPRNNTKSEDTVNLIDSINSAGSMSTEDVMNSNEIVYSDEFFDTNIRKNYKNKDENEATLDFTKMSSKRLQEAIIWSEILEKPVSKRGKRR
jgi:hypothetical protein